MSTRVATMLRDTLVSHRADRLTRQRLQRELAEFRTPAERLELEAILERHSPEETREARSILARQALVWPSSPGTRRIA